jgi:hypothetical protein
MPETRRWYGNASRIAFCFCAMGLYYYWRRVPRSVEHLDDRAPFIRHSLKTDDLAEAGAKRDLLEQADRTFWGALLTGGDNAKALAAYQVARARAEALGFTYKPANEVANSIDQKPR